MTNDIFSFLRQYKGISADTKMPYQKKATLTLRWTQIRCCASPNITQKNSGSDEETPGNDNDDYNDDTWDNDIDNSTYAAAKTTEDLNLWMSNGDAYGVNTANDILTNTTTGSLSGSHSRFYSSATGGPSGFSSININNN